jgi:hypothetical protein
MHLKGRLSINLVVLVVILLLDGETFLVREEEVFVPVLSVPLEEMLCSCPSDLLQSRSKVVSLCVEVRSHVYIVPGEARLDWVDMFSFRDIIFCFQSGFRRIPSRTVLIAASALTLFRRPDRALSSTPQSSL